MQRLNYCKLITKINKGNIPYGLYNRFWPVFWKHITMLGQVTKGALKDKYSSVSNQAASLLLNSQLQWSIPASPIYFSQVREGNDIYWKCPTQSQIPFLIWNLQNLFIRRKAVQYKVQCQDQALNHLVLMVASGGCSVLSLLTQPHIKSIDAFDMNPSQVRIFGLLTDTRSCTWWSWG